MKDFRIQEFFAQYDMWECINITPDEVTFKNSIEESVCIDSTKPKIEFKSGGSTIVFMKWPDDNEEFYKMCKTADVTLEYEKRGTSAKVKSKRHL